MPSQRHATAMAFIGDFATLDVPTMLSRRTPDCIHTFSPASLGMPPKDNTQFGDHVTRLKGVLSSFPVTPTTVFEDEAQNAVIVHATSQAKFHDKVKDDGLTDEQWTFRGEYVFMLTMDESGEKIRSLTEFLDSKGTENVFGLMKRAMENLEKLKA